MKLDHRKDLDEALVIQIRDGDQKAFNRLVERWHPRIFNYALRYSNDRIFAEEVAQKCFLHLYEKLDQLKEVSKFRGWFYRVINNECYTEGRNIKRRSELKSAAASFPERTVNNSPDELYHRKERGEIVLLALQQIPAEQRQVIIMKEYEDLKFREIAEITGESENTIKARMYYGLDALRKLLLQYKWTKELYHG